MEQNREPRNNPCLYGQLIFNEGGRSIKWSQNSLFNKCVGRSGKVHAKNESRPPTYTIHQNKHKWMKDLNIILNTVMVLEEKTGMKISDVTYTNVSTNTSSRARDIKEIIKLDYIKFKSFCMAKESIIKMKREPNIWENIFVNDTSDKGLISKIYKELI